MSNRIVYDIDGTLDLNLWGAWSHLATGKRFLNPNINPNRVKYIITGRPEIRRELTVTHLNEMGIAPKVLFMNPLGILDFDYIVRMKAAYLSILKADVYVDDDPLWLNKLSNHWDGILCDSTQVGRYL